MPCFLIIFSSSFFILVEAFNYVVILTFLKLNSGNIRVYCRIRPSFNPEAKSVIDFIGEDGSLVLLDPSKSEKDGRRVFNFNKVFGPVASQGKIIIHQNLPLHKFCAFLIAFSMFPTIFR